jgi:hypothetical protein
MLPPRRDHRTEKQTLDEAHKLLFKQELPARAAMWLMAYYMFFPMGMTFPYMAFITFVNMVTHYAELLLCSSRFLPYARIGEFLNSPQAMKGSQGFR